MSASQQDPQRGKGEASHAASLAQKLACLVALAGACDDGVTAPPVDPDDIDGDGIPNEQDVCPAVHDPPQHDEDGDGFGDLCDVCPTVVDPAQRDRGEVDANAFEDGVGDACDLRPSRAGDKLRALHTFAVDTTPAWMGAGWTIADDRARASGAARWQHRRPESGDAAFAWLTVESLTFTSEGASLAVALDGDGVESGRICALFQDRNDDTSDELELRELGGAVVIRELGGALEGPLQLVVLRGIDRMGNGRVVCRLHRGDTMLEASIATSDATTTGQYVMAAGGADVAVTSLAVYASPTSCPTLALACPLP